MYLFQYFDTIYLTFLWWCVYKINIIWKIRSIYSWQHNNLISYILEWRHKLFYGGKNSCIFLSAVNIKELSRSLSYIKCLWLCLSSYHRHYYYDGYKLSKQHEEDIPQQRNGFLDTNTLYTNTIVLQHPLMWGSLLRLSYTNKY